MRQILFMTVALLAGTTVMTSCKKLVACLDADVTTAKLGQPVTFKDCSENGYDMSVKFGDGKFTTSSAQLTHTYHAPGSYTATIDVSSKNGKKSDNASVTISVEQAAAQEFMGNWDHYKVEEYVAFFGEPALTDSWEPGERNLTLSAGGEAEIEGYQTTWSLTPSANTVVIGSTGYTVHTQYNNMLVLKEDFFGFGYDLHYFQRK